MIYVDTLMSHGWFRNGKAVKSCHLYSDGGLSELVTFAKKIGLKPEHIQRSRLGVQHFDLVESKRKMAVRRGAKELTRREIVDILGENNDDTNL